MLCSIGKSPEFFHERRVRTTTRAFTVNHANKWLPVLVSKPNFLTIRSNSRAASGIDPVNLLREYRPHVLKVRPEPLAFLFKAKVEFGNGCLQIGNSFGKVLSKAKLIDLCRLKDALAIFFQSFNGKWFSNPETIVPQAVQCKGRPLWYGQRFRAVCSRRLMLCHNVPPITYTG